MQQTLIGLVVAFAVLLTGFRLLELTRPPEKRLPLLRPGFWTDVAWWFFQSIVTRTTTRIAVAIVAVPIVLVAYGRIDRLEIANGFGPAATLPLWVQAIAILVLGDFLHYWMHRWFHGRRMWRFHAVHHSSEHLDWLAAVRGHPVNDAVMRIATSLPVLALGFAPVAVAGIVPVLLLMAILGHANVDWDFGPLRKVIVSPRFHRWHHTYESEARDKNFAGFLPLWDILFGTYYLPPDRLPARFGTSTPVPKGLLGQLAFPFRRSEPEGSASQPRHTTARIGVGS